jgi:hypothetical protein
MIKTIDIENIILKKQYLIALFIFLLLVIFFVFRPANVGTDTITYISDFSHYLILNHHDIAYVFLIKILNIFSNDYSLFFFIFSLLIFPPILAAINKYSINILLSVLIFILYYYCYTLNIMRQFIVIGLFYCFGIDFILKKEQIKYYFLIFFCFLFHFSALIFIPIYFIINHKFSFRVYVISWVASIILFFVSINNILSIIFKFLGLFISGYLKNIPNYLISSSSVINHSITVYRLILFNIFFILFIIGLKKIESNKYGTLFFNLFTIGIVLMNIFYFFVPFLRIPLYFHFSMIFLFPFIFSQGRYKQIWIISFLVVSILIFFQIFVRGGEAGVF